jgi:DnaJ-domain-containing protein 1
MDPILERFNRLIKSMFVDTDDINFGYENFSSDLNNDYADAWDELNEFLSSPESESKKYSGSFSDTKKAPIPPEVLRPDYVNLNVPFGSNYSLVKQSYKQLIIKFHPDKNSNSQETMSKATEKTKDLNISIQRIKAWEQAKKG